MADEQSDSTEQSDDREGTSHQPRECMPCRGSGHVISNLGGTAANVSCPWCGGSGQRAPGVDAQAGWLAERARQEGEEGATSVPAPEQGTSPPAESAADAQAPTA